MKISYEQTVTLYEHKRNGMRDMQAKVHEAREKQYLLVKAPPGFGQVEGDADVCTLQPQKQAGNQESCGVSARDFYRQEF